MENNSLSRQEIEWKIIYPALLRAGWEEKQIQYRKRFSNGLSYMKVDNESLLTFVEAKQPTFTLRYWDNLPLAIIRHAESGESLPNALRNALPWADPDNGGLDVLAVYTTDGTRFLEFDTYDGHQRFLELDQFPSPHQVWCCYLHSRGLRFPQGFKLFTGTLGHTEWPLRFFEFIAINRILETLLRGDRRMAVINGAFGSIHFVIAALIRHLWEHRMAKRFLYLTETHPDLQPAILLHFGNLKSSIYAPGEPVVEDEYRPDIILAAYSSTGHLGEKLRIYPPDFFDVVILDEIHRDTKDANREWQKILGWFEGAIYIGLTVMDFSPLYPSNYHFFERVIYRYTSDQARADGYHQLPEIIAAQPGKGILYLPQMTRRDSKEMPAG